MDHHGNFFFGRIAIVLPMLLLSCFFLWYQALSSKRVFVSQVSALPMVASLSITHALTPPHPAPAALAAMLHADVAQNPDLGLCIAFASRYGGRASVFILFQERESHRNPNTSHWPGSGTRQKIVFADGNPAYITYHNGQPWKQAHFCSPKIYLHFVFFAYHGNDYVGIYSHMVSWN